MLRGGCFCGLIRYEASGAPFNATMCHCSICRRTTGAPFVAWFSMKRADFRLVAGVPARFRSTDKGERCFCPRCGAQLTFEHSDLPEEMDVTTCSLDDPEAVPPDDHTQASSKLSWIHLADGLPEFAESRPDPRGSGASRA